MVYSRIHQVYNTSAWLGVEVVVQAPLGDEKT